MTKKVISFQGVCIFLRISINNLYFRYMAHKKVEKTDGKYLQRLQQIYVYTTKPYNAKKCMTNMHAT